MTGLLDINFFLICFGILGCYAAWRTTHRGWLKAVLGLLVAICLVQLVMNRFFPPQPRALSGAVASVSTPAKSASPQTAANETTDDGIVGFLRNEWNALQTDSCALTYMRETPLSPLVYALQVNKFVKGFKQLQAAPPDMGSASKLLVQSFGDEDYTARKSGDASLCNDFGKWVTKVAGRPPAEQQAIWNDLRSSTEEDNDHP